MSQLLEASIKVAHACCGMADSELPGRLSDIVKLHAGIAVAAVFVPIPGADLAAAAVNIWTMYARINSELGVTIEENILKSLAAGVVTNIGGAVAGMLVAGTVIKFIPGLGAIGGAAVMSATIFGVTVASGIIYMRVLAAAHSMQASGGLTEDSLRKAAETAMKDKDSLKEIIKAERDSYKTK